MKTDITYFDKPGKQNTKNVIELSVRKAVARKIKHIIVASGTGKTGAMVAEKASRKGIKTVVVTYQHGFEEKGKWTIEEPYFGKLQKLGVKIISATHALSGVERSYTKKMGGPSRVETVAEALRSLYGQGTKVCIEVTLMASDSGAIPVDNKTEVIAIAGTDEGADTALIMKPSHANSFFDLEVREIIAMPRKR